MKSLTYIFTIIVVLFVACNSPESKITTSTPSSLPPEPNILARLKYQKQIIDTLFNQSNEKLIVLVKLTNSDVPILKKDGNYPENVETTFFFFKDSLGKVLTAAECPHSVSGDWFLIYTHYFDKDGKTFAFEKQLNFFNSFCTAGVAFETQTEFFNGDFQSIDKMYKLVDEEGRGLQKDSCQFPCFNDYKISAHIDIFLQTNSINNRR